MQTCHLYKTHYKQISERESVESKNVKFYGQSSTCMCEHPFFLVKNVHSSSSMNINKLNCKGELEHCEVPIQLFLGIG